MKVFSGILGAILAMTATVAAQDIERRPEGKAPAVAPERANGGSSEPLLSRGEAIGGAIGAAAGWVIGAKFGLVTAGVGFSAAPLFAAAGGALGAWAGGKIERALKSGP